MTEDKWFKAKKVGWGWTPCSWQGWMVIIVSMVIYGLLLVMLVGQIENHNVFLATIFGLLIVLDFAVVFYLCIKKGENPGKFKFW